MLNIFADWPKSQNLVPAKHVLSQNHRKMYLQKNCHPKINRYIWYRVVMGCGHTSVP